jgi:hypothetical protein
MNDFIQRFKYSWKGPLFIIGSAAMPFLDEHTDKIIMALMMIIGIEDSSKAFGHKSKRKLKK